MQSMRIYCRERDWSFKKVFDFLVDEDIIVKYNDELRELSTPFDLVQQGSTISMVPESADRFLQQFDGEFRIPFKDVVLIDSIKTPALRFKRLQEEIQNKKILFIDVEMVEGNYYEIAWELWFKNEMQDSAYFVERKHLLKRKDTPKWKKKLKILHENKIRLEALPRKKINSLLKKIVEDTDFLIAHNAYSERYILNKNLKHKLPKGSFLCTAKLSRGLVNVNNYSPSLDDLVDYYKCHANRVCNHYANEDVKRTRKVFRSMLNDAENQFKLEKEKECQI